VTQDLGDRRTYIGASDIAGVIGVSPFTSPIELWQHKHGLLEQDVNDAMRMGTLLEDAICQLYEEREGVRTHRRNAPYVHPVYPFIQGHVDRLVMGHPLGMDAKASLYAPGYGEDGTDQVPPHVRVQMAIYMGLSKRERWDVALLRDMRLRVYHLTHDPELYEALVAEAVRFWTEHVLTGIPPAIDGTEEYRRYLSARYPADDGIEMVATPELALLVDDLAGVRQDVRALESRQTLIENRLRGAMGDASVLLAPGGKVTWKKNKDSERVDWKALGADVAGFLDSERYAALLDKHTETATGVRVFRFTPTKALEEAA
jgi:putative phage-type endonuclease